MLSFTLEEIFLRAGLRPTSIPTILAFDPVARNIRRGWNIVHSVVGLCCWYYSDWIRIDIAETKIFVASRVNFRLILSIRFHWIILELKNTLNCPRRVRIQFLQKFEKFARVQMFVKDVPIPPFFHRFLFFPPRSSMIHYLADMQLAVILQNCSILHTKRT